MNFQTLNKQRKLILIFAVAGVISVFLPWFSAGAFGFSVHINGFRGWGILAFLCFAASVAVALIGTQTEALEKNAWLAAIVCSVLALLSVIITLASSHSGEFGFVSADLGFGLWMALAASAGILLCAWIFRNPQLSLKGSLETLKNSVATSTASFASTAKPATDKIAELERLSKLKESGSITEEEFQQLKSKLL